MNVHQSLGIAAELGASKPFTSLRAPLAKDAGNSQVPHGLRVVVDCQRVSNDFHLILDGACPARWSFPRNRRGLIRSILFHQPNHRSGAGNVF